MSTAKMAPGSPDRNTVYWLEDSKGRILPSIVGDVEVRAAESMLCFYDTSRPHMLPAKFKSGSAATGFVYDALDGGTYTLRRLDRATFDKVFRGGIPGVPAFKTDAELQAYYLRVIRQD